MSLCYGSDYSSWEERRVSAVLTKPSGSEVSSHPGSFHSSHVGRAMGSPKKRLRVTTPSLSSSPKINLLEPTRLHETQLQTTTPSPPTSPQLNLRVLSKDPQKQSKIATAFPTNTDIQSLSTLPLHLQFMEFSAWLTDFRPKEILQLQSDTEGRYQMGIVSEQQLESWKCQYSKLIDCDKLRYEYNFLSKGLIIKCMPLPTHDSLQIFFTRNLSHSLTQRFGFSEAEEMVIIGSGTTFSGFTDDSNGVSAKLPDAYARLPNSKFPTVVCEAGWSETLDQLLQDARLWLLHTEGQTRIVIILTFTEKISKTQTVLPDNPVAAAEALTSDGGTGGTGSSGVVTGEVPNDEEKDLSSINETTNINDLAKQLFDKDGKLAPPLVGDLEANLYIYRASKEKDIEESFTTTLLPPPPAQHSSPKEFAISFKELFGESVPEGENPHDEIRLSLANLQKCIEMSIPLTEQLRATGCAKKLLKSITELGDDC